MFKSISKYFNWLQRDVPAGGVEKYPLIDSKGETSVEGVYIIGDLTGIPLLKFAAESGREIIERFNADASFQSERNNIKSDDVFDFVIVGAGPAGISAGIEALKNNYKFKILESAERFSTICNFPKGKPIFAEPDDMEQSSELKINNGTKESLLEELRSQIMDYQLPVEENTEVGKIEKGKEYFTLATNRGEIFALRVILAIGKSGNARKLNAPGENLPKVFDRLFDPADAEGHDVLVVGGGDSALETAIAAADYADSVTLSYRKSEFARPKTGNIVKLEKLTASGKINLEMKTRVKEIKENSVTLYGGEGEKEIKNSLVYTMIGRELPTEFFKRSGIKMEGELSLNSKLQFLLLIFISGVIYFGKSSAAFYKHFTNVKFHSFSETVSQFFSLDFWSKMITLPYVILSTLFSDSVRIWSVTKYLSAFVAYVSFIGAVLLGIYLFIIFIKDYYPKISLNWQTFKYSYFILAALFFVVIFFGGKYFGYELLGKSQGFWYTALYSLTIFIFGLRRMKMKPTRYIKYQTWTLITVQILALFLLPEFILPALGKAGLLGAKDGFVLTQVFPNGSYWRSYGFILAWPLNFSNLYNGHITSFWLIFSLFQTFVVIPFIVYKWGKGAYCGWICSCGGLAETLGDEYRTLAPHGPRAKKRENIGQWILGAAFIITALKLVSILYNIEIPILNENISYTADFFQKFYHVGIDIIFAGVLGVGVYFFMSGRIWCRYGCPLAALMHIYSRFSKFRIFADKKKCISCNICTKVCHMGIDVMNYANKGIPLNDVECVRCSSCIVNCPTQVLSFGSVQKADAANESYKLAEPELFDSSDWRSGK